MLTPVFPARRRSPAEQVVQKSSNQHDVRGVVPKLSDLPLALNRGAAHLVTEGIGPGTSGAARARGMQCESAGEQS